MIVRSLAKFIKDNFNLQVFVGSVDIEFEKITLPFCLVSVLPNYSEKIHYIGDMRRQVEAEYQIDIYAKEYDEMVRLESLIRKKIRENKVYDNEYGMVSGIDLMAIYHKLFSDDGIHYYSNQKGWYSEPEVKVYRNFEIIADGFTIDYDNGIIIFDNQQNINDDIRATFKYGVIDFEEVSVVYNIPEPQERKVYTVYITLKPFLYHKLTENLY